MKNTIDNWIIGNFLILFSAFKVSIKGMSKRLSVGILELVPLGLFYLAHTVIIYAMFSVIQGETILKRDLMVFIFILIAIDSLGDALLFKGLQEYTKSLRRGQSYYYLLSPGTPIFKVLFLRWDVPMILLGSISGLLAVIVSYVYYDTPPFILGFALVVGVITHVVLTGAFHVIQAYFDSTMPLPLGSPSSRIYTKPIHLLVSQGIGLIIIMSIYPAYLITAMPAGIAINRTVSNILQHLGLWYILGISCIALWLYFLNIIVRKSCQKYQN